MAGTPGHSSGVSFGVMPDNPRGIAIFFATSGRNTPPRFCRLYSRIFTASLLPMGGRHPASCSTTLATATEATSKPQDRSVRHEHGQGEEGLPIGDDGS